MNPNFTKVKSKPTAEQLRDCINTGMCNNDILDKYDISLSTLNVRRAEMREPFDGCSQCGQCCKTLVFGAAWSGKDWEEKYAAHGCYVEPGVGFIVPCTCTHLIKQDNGKYYCGIYDHRPNLCRNSYLKEKGFGSRKPEGCTRIDATIDPKEGYE